MADKKTLKDYILQAAKEYNYRLKFAFPLTEDNIATIEKCAKKYDMIDMTKPKRLMLQKNPLDFKNLDPNRSNSGGRNDKISCINRIISSRITSSVGSC